MYSLIVKICAIVLWMSNTNAFPWHDYYSDYPMPEYQTPWQDTSRYPVYNYQAPMGTTPLQNSGNYPQMNHQRPTMDNPRYTPNYYNESPMTSYGNSMPNYRYNPNYGSSYQNRAVDPTNYAYGSPRPNYSQNSNPNYGYSSGQRYEPRQNMHPHYYSERNLMSFK